jgi:hypothetical protein
MEKLSENFAKLRKSPQIPPESIKSSKIRAIVIEAPRDLDPALFKKHKLDESGTFIFKKGYQGKMQTI